MCWSGSASIAATGVGVVATTYAIKKGLPKVQIFTLAYFTLMEFLQAISYIWIGQCGIGPNTTLTYLSYAHIVFQPPVISAFMLSFLPEKTRKKWLKPALIIAFISSFFLFIKGIVPVVWDVPVEYMCRIGDTLCGTDICTYRGDWHQAWRLPLLGYIPGVFLYFIPVFLLPFFYGGWRVSIYHFVFGPLLAYLLTSDINEAPAIWCLFSIALICFALFKPLQLKFGVKKRDK